jgi:hypothetical protein
MTGWAVTSKDYGVQHPETTGLRRQVGFDVERGADGEHQFNHANATPPAMSCVVFTICVQSEHA